MVGAGLLSVVQELLRPPLEQGRRRSRLLIAGETVHEVGWDRGPAGELGLERRDRGTRLWSATDPQEARFRILRDRRITVGSAHGALPCGYVSTSPPFRT